MIKNFSIFKKKPSDNEKAPTHSISAKVGEEFMDLGACWTKEDKKGGKYLSCKLQDVWTDHTDPTKSREGFVIIKEMDLINLQRLAEKVEVEEEPDIPAEDTPF